MQILWVLPSLAMGLYLGLANGMWQLLAMSAISAAVMGLIALKRRTPKDFELRITSRGVWLNKRKLPKRFVFWRKAWRIEHDRQVAELIARHSNWLTKTRFEPLDFVAGEGFELNLMRDGPHMFIVGPSGSGKSRFLNQVLGSISGEPQLLLADYKGGATLSAFGSPTTDLDDEDARKAFWQSLGQLLTDRERYLVSLGAARSNETSLSPVLVVVDELGHAIRLDRECLPALTAVASRGRSLGVHLVCANQTVSGVPRELLVNLNLRVLLSGVDEVDALQLGAKTKPARPDSGGAGLVVGRGEFRFSFRPVPIRASSMPFRER